MQPCCPGKLCQTADRALYFSRGDHHQVRKLIDDDHDLRKLFLYLLPGLTFFNSGIKPFQVSHIIFREQLVPLLHLCHSPVQRAGCFFRICDYRDHQVRDPIIDTQLHNLRIHQDQLHFIRIRLVDNAHDQRVDAHGFSRPCRPRHKEMGHLGNIRHDHFSGDILSDRKSDRRSAVPEFR